MLVKVQPRALKKEIVLSHELLDKKSDKRWIERSASISDLPFILRSWIRSSRDLSRMWRGVPSHVFSREVSSIIRGLLTKKDTIIHIACDPAMPEVVYSFMVGEIRKGELVIHYVYTKGDFRKKGIATSLLASFYRPGQTRLIYTHSSPKTVRLKTIWREVIFNPFEFLRG